MPKPPSSAPRSSKPAKPKLKLTKYAAFKSQEIPRDQIRNAPYNPRVITESAKRKLRKNLEKIGLIEPIIWNKRTGNIVGGHQRIACLDSLEGSQDYLVPVSVVDMDEATEKQQNIFLNNAEAQGEWDMVGLADMLKGIPDPELTGFDRGDLFQMFGCDPSVTDFAPKTELAPEPTEEEKERAAKKAADDAQFAARAVGNNERNPGDFYLCMVFGSDAERKAFTDSLGLPDNRYVDAQKLLRLIKGEE